MKAIFKKKSVYIIGFGLFIFLSVGAYFVFEFYYVANYFRTMQDEFKANQTVNIKGLRELQVSGGRAPRYPDLQKRLSHVKLDKIVLDVKSEPHGYIYGIPTTFLGYGYTEPRFGHYLRRLLSTGSLWEKPEDVYSEDVEAKKYGFDYKTVNVGSKFRALDSNIDEVVAFIDQLPENKWLHVHCTNGRGRTSMILTMIDIMKNAPAVPLDDILKRQHLLGSVDLNDTKVWRKGTYNTAQLTTRKQFIHDFYTFIVQRKNGGTQLWSQWYKGKTNSDVFS